MARFGAAKTVLIGLENRTQIFKEIHHGQDTQWTANRIIALLKDGYAAVAIDDTGLGGGVTDRVMEWRRDHNVNKSVFAYNAGAAPEQSHTVDFVNLRAESYWALREILREPSLRIVDSDELFQQLASLKYRYTSGGKVAIESKDEMLKRGIKSPDEADALCLAVYAMLKTRQAPRVIKTQGKGMDSWILAPELSTARQPF